MSKQLFYKFIGGLVSGALVAAAAFISEKCNISSLQEFLMLLGLAVASGVFHYLKNWFPLFKASIDNAPKPPDVQS